MKNIKTPPSVFLLFLLFSNTVLGQKIMRVTHSCSFDTEETAKTYYVDDASPDANRIVAKVMNVLVLPQNFIIKAADCTNALATADGGKRYILYSTIFLENFKKDANTQWAAYSVLAHEIGHHLSLHNFGESDTTKRKLAELEADKFAGSVLYRLGASLEEAQAGIKTFTLQGESNTHPSKKARLESVATGWKQAKDTGKEDVENRIKATAEKARQTLFSSRPSIKLMQEALSDFSFDANKTVNLKEARKVLESLSIFEFIPQRVNAEPYYCGKLPSGYEVAIWVGTYEQQDRYGIRFGNPNDRNGYISNNETYFELIKK